MNDLDRLKELLFGAEKEALDSITERVERPELRVGDMVDVLPEAIHQSYREGPDLVKAMADPVGECLHDAFHREPQKYGDALYPVIGPAIRKSISHALKNLSQQINQAVEHSLTPKGLGWRLQASRAGIPFGEFVLQKTLLYRVEQAYLIRRESGLLIDHAHHENSKIKDSDAVSAMFTAIQDFVKESFSPDRTGRLESADMGEFTLWAMHGPHALLVCVIRGMPPNHLRGELNAILERIHFRHTDVIKSKDSDATALAEIREDLEKCLQFQAVQSSEQKKRGLSVALILAALIAFAWLGYLMFEDWREAKQLSQLESLFAQTPGYYVAGTASADGLLGVRGLRDPLADEVAAVLEGAPFPATDVRAQFAPFHSLEPEIVQRRIDRLVGDQAVSYELNGSAVVLSGEASGDWIFDASRLLPTIAGIDSVALDEVANLDVRALEATVAGVANTRFSFSDGTTLVEGEEQRLREFARQLRDIQNEAARWGRVLNVDLVGSTDGSGNRAANELLARQRAERVALTLASEGVSWRAYRDAGSGRAEQVSAPQASNRYAQVEVSVVEQGQR